ncbi:MAG: Soluble lytic murein transglycosylase and related regulatory protein [Alphaproteobacteria bacterium]|nr:Soluble lytic murein transglycosylase and related regulatory protein [Alphaproteobacteria bacterium]
MVLILGATQARAQIENMCEPLIRRYEATHGIPHKLLTAISLVEYGKPYVFPTKKEAITRVRKLQEMGVTSIDVGCMQVNLKQHPSAFPTLEAAFDPATNIAYAAKFLKTKKISKGSWGSAVAHYHSSTPRFHIPYTQRVLKTWSKAQNGRMINHALLKREGSAVEMTYAEVKKHEGAFIDNVAAPSGRRVPMIVRFAPYKGFCRKGFHRTIPGISQPLRQAQENRAGGPLIIRGRPKGSGKIIMNTVGMGQRPFFISVKVNQVNLPHHSQNMVMPKSP